MKKRADGNQYHFLLAIVLIFLIEIVSVQVFSMATEIKTIEEKKLIGMREVMSLIEHRSYKLFHTFMPRRKEIENRLNANVLDLKIYPENYYSSFSPSADFEKWAVIEVSNFENIPLGMETFVLPVGKYAVFTDKVGDDSIFTYIFSEWLPSSGYQLDSRPHFDVLNEKTKSSNSKSKQEIWIPIC